MDITSANYRAVRKLTVYITTFSILTMNKGKLAFSSLRECAVPATVIILPAINPDNGKTKEKQSHSSRHS